MGGMAHAIDVEFEVIRNPTTFGNSRSAPFFERLRTVQSIVELRLLKTMRPFFRVRLRGACRDSSLGSLMGLLAFAGTHSASADFITAAAASFFSSTSIRS